MLIVLEFQYMLLDSQEYSMDPSLIMIDTAIIDVWKRENDTGSLEQIRNTNGAT